MVCLIIGTLRIGFWNGKLFSLVFPLLLWRIISALSKFVVNSKQYNWNVSSKYFFWINFVLSCHLSDLVWNTGPADSDAKCLSVVLLISRDIYSQIVSKILIEIERFNGLLASSSCTWMHCIFMSKHWCVVTTRVQCIWEQYYLIDRNLSKSKII